MKNGGLILKVVVGIIFVLAIVGMYMVAASGEDPAKLDGAASFVVNLAVALLVVAGILTVISSVISLVKHPAGLKKTLLGLAIFAVLFLISFFAANNAQVLGANGEKLLDAGSVSKWAGAGLNFTYILLGVGGLFFVVDLVKGLIKS